MKDTRTNDYINRVIAKFNGWREITFSVGKPLWERDGLARRQTLPPNYCRDLNAVHEAESKLELQASGRFAEQLRDAVLDATKLPWVDHGSFAHVHATARQRSEALVRVIESSSQRTPPTP